MKSSHRTPVFIMFAAFLLIITQTTAWAAGVAVVKEQPHHSDAGADPFIYSEVTDDGGPFIKFSSNGKIVAIERNKVAGKIDVLASMPYNITNEKEIGVVRRSLKGIQDFSTKYPKSTPLLAGHITAMDNHIKQFDAGKERRDGVWLDKGNYKSPEILTFGKERFTEFKFKDIRDGKLIFNHKNGAGSYPIKNLTESQKKWLEGKVGTHRIGPVGFSNFSLIMNNYPLLIFSDYHFISNIRLAGMDIDGIKLDADGKEVRINLSELPAIEATMSATDQARISGWKKVVLNRLFDQVKSKTRSDIISVERLTENFVAKTLLAKIFQVIPDTGVLTDKSRLELIVGTRSIRVETYKTLANPFSGEQEERIVSSSKEKEDIVETEVLGFAFIELPTVGMFEGKVVQFDHLKQTGTYQYIDVLGRTRTVQKYTGTLTH